MKEPKIRYLVASPTGDVPVRDSRLDYPLEADPLKTSYRHYFRAVTDFLSRENFRPLLEAFNKQMGSDFGVDALNEIIIRTEKHGALYHPASVECVAEDRKAKFALNVAVTATGRKALKKEYEVLRTLREKCALPYLPQPFFIDEMHPMVFLLEEWFEDYHEFHIAKSEQGQEQMKLWEYGKGYLFLSHEQSFEIYRQIAMILTLYYDVEHYRMIFPWHHAAGDFVVKVGNGNPEDKIDTRLTTARGYEPLMGSDDDTLHPFMALFFFFLHLSLQMRLDRLDGVGDVVWASDECVDATISGFFAGLESKTAFRNHLSSTAEFLRLLRSFSAADLAVSLSPVVEQYEKTKDFPVIDRNLEDHIARLFSTLRNCH
jgi:hypothetical protein